MCAMARPVGHYCSCRVYGVRLFSLVSFHESESSIEFSDDLSKRSLRHKSPPCAYQTHAVVIIITYIRHLYRCIHVPKSVNHHHRTRKEHYSKIL